jgi:predicted nucleic acid-binding protein
MWLMMPWKCRLLECAQAAGAEYLVTGNTRHFPKAVTAIVTPKQFIDVVLPLLAKLRNRKQRR